MRTKEKWLNHIQPKFIAEKFPPRLQRDLTSIPMKETPETINSLYLWGGVSTGKTVYAAQYMVFAAQQAYLQEQAPMNYEFISISSLILELQHTYDSKECSYVDVIRKYSGIDFLILDDMGTVKPSNWVLQSLYMIINERYEQLKITVITSNFNLTQLATHFEDARIPARIERMCRMVKKNHWKTK